MKTLIPVIILLSIFFSSIWVTACFYGEDQDGGGEGDVCFWFESCSSCRGTYNDCMKDCYTTTNLSDYEACDSHCSDQEYECEQTCCEPS